MNGSRNLKNGVKPAIPEKPKAISLALKRILEKKETIENEKDFVYRNQDKDNELPIKTIKRVSKNKLKKKLLNNALLYARRGDFPKMKSPLI